jgi:hypothetical protein
MHDQKETILNHVQRTEEEIDDDTFCKWKDQLERSLPVLWESIYDSENCFLDRTKQSVRDSIDMLFSRDTETLKSRMSNNQDGFFNFNFLR